MMITYRYKLLPSKRQYESLETLLEEQRILYNAALQERVDCYRKTGKSIGYFDQCKSMTVCRGQSLEMRTIPLSLQRWTLKRLDDAFKAFFRRARHQNGKAGYPRFKGRGRWNSFGFKDIDGIRWDGKRLRFKGMPSGLRVHLHRQLPEDADIRSYVFTRTDRQWHVCFQVRLPAVEGGVADNVIYQDEHRPEHLAPACESLPTNREHLAPRAVGLDLGIKTLAYQSDGHIIPNPQIARKAERELRRRQRAFTRCKRGSKRRQKVRARVASLHRKIAHTRNTYLHQHSARLTKNYDIIVAEDLNVSGMIRSAKGTIEQPGTNVRAKSGLNRAIADAGWSKFLGMIAYKAERAGGQFITVNPKNTSQKCSGCGKLVPKSLVVRTHSCPHCSLVIDRDWNASLNILAAVVGRRPDNVAHQGKRSAGNIILATK